MLTKKNLSLLIGKHLLITAGVILCAVIITMFLSHEITKVSDSVIKNKKLANILTERTSLLEKIKKDMAIVGRNDIAIDNAFIPSNNITDFLSILDSMALKNSITQTFHFDSPIPATISAPFPINTINYNNSLSANLPTLIQYLKDVERLPYFTKINGFNISSQSPVGILGLSTVSFQATLYTKAVQ